MILRTRPVWAANPYVVLGMSQSSSATTSDIKKAFHRKAATLHPDVGGDEEKFKELRDAFDTLMKHHGGSKHGATAEEAAAGSSGGRGFYDSPHARWANDRASERRQKRDHFDHDHQEATHGAGLGDAFSDSAGWDATRGRWRNYSTAHFYRPYQSDFTDPYGHGFTPEEMRAAEEANRKARRRTVLRHGCLWGGLLFVVWMHQRHDRINRATRARDAGYADPAYWQAVDEERSRHRVLRQGDLWWEKPLEPLWVTEEDKEKEMEEKRNRSDSPNGKATRLGAPRAMAAAPRAVSFRGRPFTPNGVRNPRVSLPKNQTTFVNDVSFEPEDIDGIEES